MSSRIERTLAAALGALLVLGCPDSAPAELTPLPPVTVLPPMRVEDAGVPAAAKVQTLGAIVFEFDGKAEVRRAGATEWVMLAVGDAVRVSDEVRTSADGSLELRLGEARIQVHEGSELTLKFLEARAIRAEVRGRASGETPDGGELAFEGGGGLAVGRGGQLSLDATDGGAVASSLSGGLTLTSGGKTVTLGPGEIATIDGATMTRPAKIPQRVALAVKWPEQTETNQPTLVLKGRASASARVLVMGRRVETAADGAFEAKVPLKKGPQNITVVVIDPLGRKKTEKRKITFDPNAPSVTGKVEYR